MEIKPLYSLAEVAPLERCAPGTLRNRIAREAKLPVEQQRYPNYRRGYIPLADLKARFDLTTDELREFDVPNESARWGSARWAGDDEPAESTG